MKFLIITPTHERPVELEKCITSVLSQKYKDFEVIIVNDSPAYDYSNFEKRYKDLPKITYCKNKKNEGVNFSRNHALELIKNKSGDYVIFLDDDDWLYPDALEKINGILETEKPHWLVTNRTHQKTILINIKKQKDKYSYFFDMLLFRRIYGDGTHIIKKQHAEKYRFCSQVKNGEEFYYYIQLPFYFLYKNINSTDSNGYTVGGLTDSLNTRYVDNTYLLWKEKGTLKIFIYLIIRTLWSIFK